MNQADEAALVNYPHGRGYGHDYMRGGEVLGGYGYAERDEYAKARGEPPENILSKVPLTRAREASPKQPKRSEIDRLLGAMVSRFFCG